LYFPEAKKEEEPKTENLASADENLILIIQKMQSQMDALLERNEKLSLDNQKLYIENNNVRVELAQIEKSISKGEEIFQIEAVEEVAQEEETFSPEASQETFVKNPEVPTDRTAKLEKLKKSKPVDHNPKVMTDWFEKPL